LPPARRIRFPITVEGRTNLDTLAWYTGRLVVGVFNDDVAGGPVSLLEVRGEAGRSGKSSLRLHTLISTWPPPSGGGT
jgi:hypothetical protein